MLNIKDNFYNENKRKSFLEELNDREDAFWGAINYLAEFNKEKFKEEDMLFFHCRHFISARLVNHILATYQMLRMGLEDECLIMLRQSNELSWLLKYFIDNPHKVENWVKKRDLKITPYQRRLAVDNNSASQETYSRLSNVVHSNRDTFWGSYIGGMYNSWVTNQLFGEILTLIFNTMGYLDEIILLFEINLDNGEIAKMKKTAENNIGYAIYDTSYILNPFDTINKLKELNEEDVVRYLEENFEIVD